MSIENERQLENTREKLRLIEEHYERRRKEPADDKDARELTLWSLNKTINQLKEEIVRYECHAKSPQHATPR
jgi:hypothetical protein